MWRIEANRVYMYKKGKEEVNFRLRNALFCYLFIHITKSLRVYISRKTFSVVVFTVSVVIYKRKPTWLLISWLKKPLTFAFRFTCCLFLFFSDTLFHVTLVFLFRSFLPASVYMYMEKNGSILLAEAKRCMCIILIKFVKIMFQTWRFKFLL